ncbi:MAG TPA: pyruvate oxidoreductase subunit gamma [Firmicutes bacterium]|nr:pyruvate oxidoreductase subunit gamma [Bacillota bacterium]
MNKKHWRIVVAGEGGQGVQLIGEILAESAFRAGKEAIYIPNFGVEQRGGVSIAMVQIAEQALGAPKFEKADILVPLSERAVERTLAYIKRDTFYIYEASAIAPPQLLDATVGIQAWETVAPEAFSLAVGSKPQAPSRPPADMGLMPDRTIGIPAAEIARAELKPRVFNIIILGAILVASGVLSLAMVQEGMLAKLGDKLRRDPELKQLNLRALDRGWAYVTEAVRRETNR